MAAKTLLSEEEYLSTSFDGPEPDYLEGELVERSMPTTRHSRAGRKLIVRSTQPNLSLCAFPELRIRVATRRYRVVDLALFDHEPADDIPIETPLAAIEILSPDDSYTELRRKFEDYELLGIPHIWLVDPITRSFAIYRQASLTNVGELTIPSHNFTLRLADIFE